MPRLLRLDGRDLLRIIPIHGHENLAPGMIHRLYRDASWYIPESELEKYFYAE